MRRPFSPGIVSIVFAAQVNGKMAQGDMAGATAASNNAKLWAWIGFGAGFFAYGGFFTIGILGNM